MAGDFSGMPWTRLEESRRSHWLWLAFGLAVVVLALGVLERREAFYFCQDDALVSELPLWLGACRSVWNGVLPEYNPYNLLGTPLLAMGAGLTYPPLYLAYAVARHVLGNEYATVDVFAAMHLLAGFAVTYLVARRLGFHPAVACLVGLSLVLSGVMLITGRCWPIFLLVPVFQPLLVLAADRLRRGPVGWRWATATGLVLGLYYHGGFPQLWVFGVFFFVLHLLCLWVWRTVPFRRLLWAVPALLVAASLVLPLLTQQWLLSRDMGPYQGRSGGIGYRFWPFFLPYPLCRDTLPDDWGSTDYHYGGHFYYAGTLLSVLFLVALGDWLWALTRRRWRGTRLRVGAHVWTLLAVVALVFCLGDAGYAWKLVAKLPGGLNSHPFRILPFFVLFSSLAGGMILQRLLGRMPMPRAKAVAAGVTVIGCVLLLYHVGCCRAAFYSYGFRPYPPLPDELAAVLRLPSAGTPYRSVYYAPQRTVDPTYPFCLPHNLPALYQLPALFGYNPLFEHKARYRRVLDSIHEDMGSSLRAYGVRWCLVHRTAVDEPHPSPGGSHDLEKIIVFDALGGRLDFARRWAVGGPESAVEVCELDHPAPLGFRMESPGRPLPVRLDGRGIHLDLGGAALESNVVVNFLEYPELHAYVDGQPAEIRVDRWQRMVVHAPAGSRQLDVSCQPPWSAGLLAGCSLLALGILSMLILEKTGAGT
ncbi:MAG: hypothetical protein ABSG86_22030 [Thermoguttaceae bacterium]|jgi:hypothetical protein